MWKVVVGAAATLFILGAVFPHAQAWWWKRTHLRSIGARERTPASVLLLWVLFGLMVVLLLLQN